MGVRGLTSYVDSLPTGKHEVWEPYRLCNTRLIIDGNGLFHYVYATYQLDCKYGGQYSELEEKVKMVFTKLMSHGVEPYVVFDGIMDGTDKKLQTKIRRKVVRIRRARDLWKSKSEDYNRTSMVIPRLTRLACMNVLQDLGVRYAVADFEADGDISSLANALDSPVLGTDSDYFIFDVKQGYIPLDSYDLSGPSVTVKRFHRERLARHLNISSSMLPMLASLVGNDYVSDEILKSFKMNIRQLSCSRNCVGKVSDISRTAAFLSMCKSVDEAMTAVLEDSPQSQMQEFEKALCMSIEEYQIKPTHLLGYFEKGDLGCNLLTYNGQRIPTWVIKLYREGAFGKQCMSCMCQRKVFLDVQVEDMSKPSANQCTLNIRRYLYRIVMKYDHKVDEHAVGYKGMILTQYDRECLSFIPRKTDVEMVTLETEINISKIPKMSKENKMACLLSVLCCDLALVQHLPIKWQLVAAVAKYWIINATPPLTAEHLAALLAYHVGEKNNHINRQCHELDVKGLHGFSQWQNVAGCANDLNSLFCNVFPNLCPARLYDGVQVCKLYGKLRSCGIKTVEAFVTDVQLFQQLYDAVLKDIPSDCQFNQSRQIKQKKGTKKNTEVKTAVKSSDVLEGNHFAHLRISSDTDED